MAELIGVKDSQEAVPTYSSMQTGSSDGKDKAAVLGDLKENEAKLPIAVEEHVGENNHNKGKDVLTLVHHQKS